MNTSSSNRLIVWSVFIAAAVANIAGLVWELYDRFSWFDEVIHTFTSFALTLPLILFLYGAVLRGAHARPVLFVLVAASVGITAGTLWEIVEWIYDQIVPGNVIKGKTDTMIDLVLDAVGALLAGVVSMRMIPADP